MTDKHDKLVEAAQAAGFCYVGGTLFAHDIDLTPKLAAFASAHVASLCADVKPWVWLVTGSRVFDDQVEFTQSKAEARIAERKDGSECVPLVPASVVASLTAQRDAALARVAELEKDAARYRWLRNRIDPREISECFGFRGHNVDEKISLRTDSSIDAALTKGQLAPQPQQEQSN